MFSEIPKELDSLKKLPKHGGWVMCRERPDLNKDHPIVRGNIYYASNEQLACSEQTLTSLKKSFSGVKTNEDNYIESLEKELNLQDTIYDFNFLFDEEEIEESKKPEKFLDYFQEKMDYQCSNGFTVVDISIFYPELTRLYSNEFSYIPEERLNLYLKQNLIKPIQFGDEEDGIEGIFTEMSKDIIDAMQVDGLSKSEAINNLVTTGYLRKKKFIVPRYYYQLQVEI